MPYCSQKGPPATGLLALFRGHWSMQHFSHLFRGRLPATLRSRMSTTCGNDAVQLHYREAQNPDNFVVPTGAAPLAILRRFSPFLLQLGAIVTQLSMLGFSRFYNKDALARQDRHCVVKVIAPIPTNAGLALPLKLPTHTANTYWPTTPTLQVSWNSIDVPVFQAI